MEIEHGGDSGDDAMPEDSVELEAAGSGSVLMVDLPIAALQDSCVGSDDARRDETPSSTPLFASILRSVLLQPQSDDSAAAQVAGLSGGGNTNKIIDDMKVFRVLNRLLSADEVLARRTDATNPRAFLTGEISTGGVIRGGSNGAGAKPPPGLSGAASRNMGLLEGSERQGDGEVGATGAGVEAAAAAMTAAATTKAAVAGTGEEVEVHLTSMLRRAPRRVCQYAFRKNDIVWICKVCQADETCVLCNDCFRSSDHKGHEVYFYHAQAGGCCDCGDPDAWDSRGFCPKHGLDSRDPMQELPKGLITSGLKVMAGVKEFLLDLARDVLQSFNLGAPWNQEGMPESIVVVLHQANISVELSSPLREIAKLDEGRMNEVLRSLREEKEEADLVTARGGGQAIRDTLEMARRLGEKGLLVSVRTLQLMERMGRALRVVRWLHKVSTLCDGTCRLVCEMLDVGTLVTLMEVDAKLPKELACKFHDLYLTLMADQPFKTRIAAAYTRALPAVTSNYARGVGTTDYGLYTLSVQFLNRSAFVKELVEKHFLLEILAECLFATLAPACEGPPTFPGERGNHVLNAKHSVMKHRRYMPIVNDLKCVLNIEGVPQRFLRVCFGDWTKIFTIVQEMAPQKRQQRTHVEYETRDWMYAFNINISLTLLFECMLSWLREPLGDASIPSGFFSRLSASGGDGDQRTEGAEGERQGHVGDRREVRENAGPSVTGNKILGARGAFEPPGIVPRALFDLPESAFSPSWIVGDGIGAAATGLGAPSPQGLFLRTFRELVRWYFARERNLASREAPRKLLVASFSTPTRRSTTPLPRHAAAAAPGRLGGRLVGKAGFPAHAVRLPRNPTNPGGSGPDLMDDGTGRSGGQMGIGEAGREVEESKERHDEEEDTAVPATQGTARPSGVVPESFVDLAQSVSDFVRSEREATMRVLKDVAQRREEAVGAAATESSTVPVPALGVVTFDEPSTDDAETAMAISPRGANAASSSAPVADAGETGVTAGSNTEGANFAEKEDPDSGGGASDYSRAWGARSRGGKAPTSRRAFDVARNPGSHAGAASGSRPGSFWDGGGAPSPAMWEWSALPTFPRGALPLRPVPPNRSFHIITHRFFAATIREACRCQEREGDLADLVECVSGHREVATDMEDVALLVLAFAAEIRAGLWKKNGQCMTDQVLNYAEMPFGKIFRDLDLLLAQFTALCCGADQLVNHILHRFQCFYWLFDEYDPPIISSTWRRLSRSSTRESVTERTGTVGGAATSSASVIPGRDVSDVGSRGGGSRGSRAGAVQGNTSADASRASSVPFGQGGSGSRGPVGSLAEHEAWTAAKAARESDGWLRRLRRKSLLDTEQQLALGEECLLLLILLVTEMPLPPDSTGASKSVERTADAADRPASSGRRSRSVANSGGGSMFGGCGTWGGSRPGGRGCNGKDAAQKPSLNSRVARQLRRELVHRLACAPCTHSELQETCQTTSQGEAFESELMEDILKEIADRREPSNALEPGKFVLKPEIFSVEYDCTFFHLSLQSHQLASERRPPVKGPTALAPPPPEAHSLFRRLRVDILVGAPTIRVVGQVLLGCVRKTAGRSRDTLLLRALHILTLAVHVCGGEPSVREPRPGESAAEAFSSEGNSDALCGVLMEPLVRPPAPPVTCGLGGSDADLGSNLHRQRDLWGELDQLSGPTTTFPGSLFAWTPFELPLSSPATRAAAEANAARAAPRPPPAPSATSAAAEEDGEKSPSSPVSVLELLLELKASSWARSDKTIAAGMDWLLERLAEMSEACRSFVESRTATASAAAGAGNSSSGGGGGKSGRNDAAAARKRMMEDIKKKADKFLRDFSMMAPDEDEDDDTEEEAIAARGTGAGGDSRADLGEPRWTEEQQKPDGEDSDPIPGVSSPGKAETRGESGAETRRRSSGKKSGAKRTGSRRGESLPTCIVCREVTDGALGYVGFGQRSLVLDARHTGRPGVHLQFCGHALHYSCFDKYFITSVQASESFSNVALDIDKGEFHCPFCKAVGNLMVPALIRDTPGESPPAPPITAAAAAAAAASKGRDHGVRWTFGQESRGDGWLETKVAAALEAAISREGAARDGDTPSASSERPMTPDVKGFLEAIREVESSASKRAPDPTPDELFLSACRSLAYSVAASAAGNSPLQALRGDAVSRGDGALAPEVDSGDVPRRRYLRQVALVLRRAAGQMGIGDMVRRKLVALLRGDEVDVLRASAERGAPAVTVPGSVMDAASAGSNQEETASIQQMVASSILRGLRGGSQTPMPSTPRGSVSAEEEGKSRGWDVRQGLTGGGGGDLDQPLLSGGAMEMLAMALVVLPEGNFESAKHCVGSFCLVRVLQVLSSPSFANPKLFVPCDSLAAATVPGVERHDGMEEDDAHGKPVSTARLAELTSMFLQERRTAKATARATATATGGELQGGSRDRANRSGIASSGTNSEPESPSTRPSSDSGAMAVDEEDASNPFETPEATVPRSCAAPDLAKRLREKRLQLRTPGTDEALRGQSEREGSGEKDQYYLRVGSHVAAFLRASLLLLHVCTASEEDQREDGAGRGAGGLPELPATETYPDLCRYFGFAETAEEFLADSGAVRAACRWLDCVDGTVTGRWARGSDPGALQPGIWPTLMIRRRLIARRLFDFPSPVKIDLVPLPHAYTELHAVVSASIRSRTVHPAVCLVCGLVLEANGKGECTKHAKTCGSGVGIIFLLQECQVLLIHGKRASYFPSPYVDAYGERHRAARGRPLFLDARRYEVVRGLWARHQVAHEVVLNRSSSRQVIINDFY